MDTYHNLVNDSFFKRPQIDSIILDRKKCLKINITYETLRNYLGSRIFFTITQFIAKEKNLKSVYCFGKITEVKPKAIQLNLSHNNWIPISQIKEILVYKEDKKLLLTDFTEVKK